MRRYSLEGFKVEERQEIIREYGFTEIKIEKWYLPIPTEINKRLQNLENYGFSKAEIISMVRKLPQILGYTAERTNELLQNLENYGFSKAEIIAMVRKLPSILGYTAERTEKLIEWFNFYKIEANLFKKSFRLIFSLKTLEARRQKLEELGFSYQQNSAPLFYSKKRWGEFIAKLIFNPFKPL